MPATPLDELAQRLAAEAVAPVLGAPLAEKKSTD
jgi:hypothetical protein